MSVKAITETRSAKGGHSPENKAAGQAWRPSVLDRMILLAQREADRIEIFQRTDQDGLPRPLASWDPGKRAERQLFLDLAQLVHLVQMVEPEFKKQVRKALGDRKQAALLKGEPASARSEPDATGEDVVPDVPGDDA